MSEEELQKIIQGGGTTPDRADPPKTSPMFAKYQRVHVHNSSHGHGRPVSEGTAIQSVRQFVCRSVMKMLS